MTLTKLKAIYLILKEKVKLQEANRIMTSHHAFHEKIELLLDIWKVSIFQNEIPHYFL